jgi:hypothetical protein
MVQAVCRRPLTMEVRVRFQVSSQSRSGVCRTKWQLDRFIAEYCDPFSPVNIISPMLHTRFHLYSVLKVKSNPRTGHEGPMGESRYCSTLSLTSALDGVGGQRHAPAALPPGKTRYPSYRRLGGPQGRTGQVRKISAPPGFDPRSVQPVTSRYTEWASPALHSALTTMKNGRSLRAFQKRNTLPVAWRKLDSTALSLSFRKW